MKTSDLRNSGSRQDPNLIPGNARATERRQKPWLNIDSSIVGPARADKVDENTLRSESILLLGALGSAALSSFALCLAAAMRRTVVFLTRHPDVTVCPAHDLLFETSKVGSIRLFDACAAFSHLWPPVFPPMRLARSCLCMVAKGHRSQETRARVDGRCASVRGDRGMPACHISRCPCF